MQIEHIKPFVDSVIETMEMMLGLTPITKRPYLKGQQPNWGDVSGLVGFAGAKVVGSIVISLPQRSALFVYEMIAGEEVHEITEEVQDAVGELTNIIAGTAKRFFAKQELHFNITTPTIIAGKHHNVAHKDGDLVLVIPFAMKGSPFVLEILIKVLEMPENI